MIVRVLKISHLTEDQISDIVDFLIEIECYNSVFDHVYNKIFINDKAKHHLEVYFTDFDCHFETYYVNEDSKWREYCRLVLLELK